MKRPVAARAAGERVFGRSRVARRWQRAVHSRRSERYGAGVDAGAGVGAAGAGISFGVLAGVGIGVGAAASVD